MADTEREGLRLRLQSAVRNAGGNRAIAAKSGIPERSVTRYVGGKAEPAALTLLRLARASNVSLEWLVSGDGDATIGSEVQNLADDAVAIPMLDVVAAAGDGRSGHTAEPVALLPFSKTLLRRLDVSTEHAHFITSRGDSMEPTISDGAIVLVDVSKRKSREDGVYVLVVGDDVRIKRVQFGVNALTLISDNAEKYPRESVRGADLEIVKVVGKVFWSGGAI